MKPRIFISSTFYDLKYIREDLANFVRSYGYEPVLFEDGDIGYTPGRTLDSSCYESMRNSDMVILIIGGAYGSVASGENKDNFKEYMSVTRNEFRTAVESGIPILVMIDKKVMAEYGVYDANYNAIEKENRKMTFPTTKNINVFRFIKEIKGIVTLPIQEFERSSDIKGFISKQWADMFKNYLSSLRNEKENRKIESSVNEMKALIQKMDIMLDSVGKNVLSKEDPKEYESVVNQQEIVSFCDLFIQTISLELKKSIDNYSINDRKKIIADILIVLKQIVDDGELKSYKITKGEKSEELFNDFCNMWGMIGYKESSDNIFRFLEKMNLLSDESFMDKIVDNMLDDRYFRKLM